MKYFATALLYAIVTSCTSNHWIVPEHEATMPVPKNAQWWQDTHRKINEDISTKKVDLLFIGDSITHWFKKFPGKMKRPVGWMSGGIFM